MASSGGKVLLGEELPGPCRQGEGAGAASPARPTGGAGVSLPCGTGVQAWLGLPSGMRKPPQQPSRAQDTARPAGPRKGWPSRVRTPRSPPGGAHAQFSHGTRGVGRDGQCWAHGGGGAYPGPRGSGQASGALQASHALKTKEGRVGEGLGPHTSLPRQPAPEKGCMLVSWPRSGPEPPAWADVPSHGQALGGQDGWDGEREGSPTHSLHLKGLPAGFSPTFGPWRPASPGSPWWPG